MAIELALGIAVAFTVLCYSASLPEQVNFLTSAMVAGTFFYCQLVPYFVPNYRVFVILEYVVVLVGSMVGGVMGILLPVASKGVSIGVLVSIVLNVLLALFPALLAWTSYQVFIVSGLCVLVVVLCAFFDESEKIALSKQLDLTAKIRSAMIVATALTLALDVVVFRHRILSPLVMSVLQLEAVTAPSDPAVYASLLALAIVWAVLLVSSLLFLHYLPSGISVSSLLSRRRGLKRKPASPAAPSAAGIELVAQSSSTTGGMKKSRSLANILNSYDPSQVNTGSVPELTTSTVSERRQRTFEVPLPCAFNYIDEENIPEPLKPFSPMVFDIGSKLTTVLGFQVDNARNQSEHLLMLLYNEFELDDVVYSQPAQRIHSKMFQNYHKWCASLNTQSQLLMDVNNVITSAMVVEDLLIYLMVWGEAANLKHMPECLCFLLHKTLIEYQRVRTVTTANKGIQKQQQQMQQDLKRSTKQSSLSSTSRMGSKRYPGYFLDMVVTPLFTVVKAQLADKSTPCPKTYDDMNEFFWTPECLNYEIFFASCMKDIEGGSEQTYIRDVSASAAASGSATLIPEHRDVAVALSKITKTYVEKRSWLHPLLAVNRVFEWHIITFTLLVSLAFSKYLVWTNTYYLQISSVIFLEMILFSVLWASLEVWVRFPFVKMSDAARCGYLLRLSFGYLMLVYQAIYFHWSFVEGDVSFLKDNWLFKEAGDVNPLFWWWQYNWISLFALSYYILSSLLCWFPGISTYFMTMDNALVQAVLSICYPVSQLYVGKELTPTQWETLRYALFWSTLIAWKLYFGYTYIISSIAVPTMELYDDFMNYGTSFWRTVVLTLALWTSHFMVYIVDMYIWYSVWSAVVGFAIALWDRQGIVRTRVGFQGYFMRAPLVFAQNLLPNLSTISIESSKLVTSHDNLAGLLPKSNQLPAEEVLGTKSNTLKAPTWEELTTGLINKQKRMVKAKSTHDFSFEPLDDTKEYVQPLKDNLYHHPNAALDSQDVDDIRSNRWTIFAQVWNKFIESMYEHDYINEEERERFVFTYFEWLTKPTYLPLYLSIGSISTAIVAFTEIQLRYASITSVDHKMQLVEDYKNQVNPSTKDALEEVWELTVWLLQTVLGNEHSNDFSIITSTIFNWGVNVDLIYSFDASKLSSIVTRLSNVVTCLLVEVKSKRSQNPVVKADIQVPALSSSEKAANGNTSGGMKKSVSSNFLSIISDLDEIKIMSKLSTELPDRARDSVRDELRLLFSDLRSGLKEAGTETGMDLTKKLTFMMAMERGFFWNDAYASKQLDALCKMRDSSLGALKKLKGLLTSRVSDIELKSPEATRRLHYFVNSLFMKMPKVPGCRFSKEYTTMTPYHSEDIIMTKKDLLERNHLGISVLLYLKARHRSEWDNFVKRCNIDTMRLWDNHEMDVRLWASRRAQTLYRTVEGMMQTEAAIRLHAELECLDEVEKEVLSKVKYNYVVACQIYGQMVQEGHSKADDINYMMEKWPNLRVAYIDWIRISPKESDVNYYSVLLKHDPTAPPTPLESSKGLTSRIREVYRVKLPGSPVLGEGKPENQNHAVIFTRGRYLQAIDMNQAGYFEEALKMRNLLEEFNKGYKIVGFKEHIFTGSASCIANYMAMQELSFVTLGQRVLFNPLRIRQHYGHPDLFDKFFVMTEGGMSKASKGTNLSEDVFAGFNATLRGHKVGFKEYVQVGKGRDVGLQQTYKFEAKLAQGNAEQSLSRDLDRICNRLDFFALLSFYYGGIGHYMSTALVMFTLTIVVYIMLALAIYKQEGVNGRPIVPEGPVQLMIAGLGLVQTLPLLATLTVEKGFGQAVHDVCGMFISGGPLYFIFHIQTKYYYFSQTLMAGGAIYRPTGRGFVMNHSPFDENYRFFASSHIYLGFELCVALIVFACYTHSSQYAGLTWPLWLVVASFLMGPFWFNPTTFRWDTVKSDYHRFMGWMDEIGGGPEKSWESWWKDDNKFFDDLSLSWKVYLALQKCSLWSVIAYGLMGHNFYTSWKEQYLVLKLVGLCVILISGHTLITSKQRYLRYPVRRMLGIALSGAIGAAILYIIVLHLHVLRYILGLYYFGAAACYLLLLIGFRNFVMPFYKFHDYVVSISIFAVLTGLSFTKLNGLHTWLVFHDALSKQDVEVTDVLDYVRESRERDEPKELRSKINTFESLLDNWKLRLANLESATTTEKQPLLRSTSGNYQATVQPENVIKQEKIPMPLEGSYFLVDKPQTSGSAFGIEKPPSLRKNSKGSGSLQVSPAVTPRSRSITGSLDGQNSAFATPPSRQDSGANSASAGVAASSAALGVAESQASKDRSASEDYVLGEL